MHIDMLILFLFLLSFLAFVSNRILSRYLYMAAGVKPSDAMIYLSQLWDDGMHRNRQEELMGWLEYRSGYAKEFYTMARYDSASGWTVVVYLLGSVVLSTAGWSRYIWAVGVAMVVVWAILTLLGVRYGKYIESETADYFDSSRYQPYQPEEPDDSSGPYYDTPPAGPFATGDTEETQRRRFRNGYARNILAVVLILAFVLVPVLSQKFSLPTASTPEATTQPQTSQSPAESSYPPLFLDTNSVAALYSRLEELGYHPAMAVGQLSDTYPGMDVVDGLLVDEFEIHLEFIQLSDQDRAQQLYQRLKSEIVGQQVENPQITQEDRDGIILYAQETGDGYTAVIQNQDFVLYTYCSLDNTTWMKWFLYELGYLSTF